MIPKQLFFIWIGENKPKYVDFAINSFKKVNPDFKVDLILEENIYSENKDFKIVRDQIKKKIYSEYNDIIYGQWSKDNIKTYKGQISRFVDCLKIHYINTYGGIYLDCDTFPLKPFDDKLLSDGFCCYTRIYHKLHKDRFFIGCDKNKYEEISKKIIFDSYSNRDYTLNKISECRKKERELFFECLFVPGKLEEELHYIKHFKLMEWQK